MNDEPVNPFVWAALLAFCVATLTVVGVCLVILYATIKYN